MAKRQYQETVEENGRLEARIQALTVNAQSEHDMLAGEVKRRDEAIQRLKNQQIALQETIGKQEEKVSVWFDGNLCQNDRLTSVEFISYSEIYFQP